VTVSFEEKATRAELAPFGKVLKFSPYEAELSLPLNNFQMSISQILKLFSVNDINIQDVAIEEIIEDVFRRK
jgi:ABC-type uncharacterized transport system ATPase subunit